MTYYLGQAGAMLALPDPEVGLSMPTERIGGSHQLLSGAKVRDTLGYSRTWQMNWTALDNATYYDLEARYYGSYGAGPYYLIDPDMRNWVAPNVSTGGDSLGTTAGFTAGAGAPFTSTNANGNWNAIGGPFPSIGPLTMGCNIPNGYLANTTLWSVTKLVAVNPGATYTCSAYVAPDVGTPGSVYLQVKWFTFSLATATGGGNPGFMNSNNIAAGTSARAVASGASATNAAFAQITMQMNAANAGAAVFFYTDGIQFEQAASASTWAPGVSQPQVTVESLTRSTPLTGVADVQMTLVQVG